MKDAKTQIMTETLFYEKRTSKNNQHGPKAPKVQTAPKRAPQTAPKRTPLTSEERKERQATQFKQKYEKAKARGLCRLCDEPAVEG